MHHVKRTGRHGGATNAALAVGTERIMVAAALENTRECVHV
jgi:hypothetical protein